MSELADAVRKLRNTDSLDTFAERAGVSVRTLCKIEGDEAPVKISTILQMAASCKLSKDDELNLIRAWLRTQLTKQIADKFWIDWREEALHDKEMSQGEKLSVAVQRLPHRIQAELLRAVDRPEVLAAIKDLNAIYDRLRQSK